MAGFSSATVERRNYGLGSNWEQPQQTPSEPTPPPPAGGRTFANGSPYTPPPAQVADPGPIQPPAPAFTPAPTLPPAETPMSSLQRISTSTSKSTPAATSPATGAGGADSLQGGPAISGLTAALGELSSGGGGSTALTQANPSVGFSGSGLREGMAQRSYPQDTYALAALKKVY